MFLLFDYHASKSFRIFLYFKVKISGLKFRFIQVIVADQLEKHALRKTSVE